jgi:hypothetical protein
VPAGGPEQKALAVLGDAGRVDVGVNCFGERVMARHCVLLAAFLMQPDRPRGAARPQIFDLHLQGGVDAREGISERGDQRAVPQIAERLSRNAVEKLPPFGTFEHRRRAGLDDVLGPAHGGCRIGGDDLADQEPVEHHPDGGELLFDRWRRGLRLQLLNIGGNVMRPDRAERQAALLAPAEELAAGPGVGPAGVGGEELDIAPTGLVTELGDQRRHDQDVGGSGGLVISAWVMVAGSWVSDGSISGPPTPKYPV